VDSRTIRKAFWLAVQPLALVFVKASLYFPLGLVGLGEPRFEFHVAIFTDKFKIEKGISRITRVKLQATIEESIAADLLKSREFPVRPHEGAHRLRFLFEIVKRPPVAVTQVGDRIDSSGQRFGGPKCVNAS
jgi:hypothetical protein